MPKPNITPKFQLFGLYKTNICLRSLINKW